MKKGVFAVLLGICMVCCNGWLGQGVFAAERIVYQQDFDSTPVGEIPPEAEASIGAALVEGSGFVHVIEKSEGSSDHALRSNHQTTAKGTNSAIITLPDAVTGAFRLEADFKFGSTVKREFEVSVPDGTVLFRIGMAAGNSLGGISSDSRLYSWVNGTTTELTDINFDISNKAEYHLTFDVDPAAQTVKMSVDGNGDWAVTVIDISGAGVVAENIGLGKMKLSTYYNNKVGSTGRFLQIDNIVVRQPAFLVNFYGNESNAVMTGNTEIAVTVSLTTLAESTEPTLLYVLYDEKGVMSDVDIDVYTVGANGVYTRTLTYDAPIPAGYRLKVFMWDAVGRMSPVGTPVSF